MIDFAALVAVEGFDTSDRPVPGTGCAACQQLGHWCPAKGYSGEHAMCLPCSCGEACGQARSVERMKSGAGVFEVEDGYVFAECRSIAIAEADRVVVDAPVRSDWAIKDSLDPANLRKGPRPKVKPLKALKPSKREKTARPKKLAVAKVVKPEEVCVAKMELEAAKAEAIRLSGVGSSINSIATATGFAWAEVKKWLVEAGLLADAPRTPKLRKSAKKSAVKAPAPARRSTVGVQVSERHLDAFWAQCSLDEKALAFGAVLESR